MGTTRTGDDFRKSLDKLKAKFEVKGLILSNEQITDLLGTQMMNDIEINIEGIFEVPKSKGKKVTILLNRKKKGRK